MKYAAEALAVGIGGLLAAVGITMTGVLDTGSLCPSGWQNASNGDEHVMVLACMRDDWLVVLNPDKSFNYGLEISNPAGVPVLDAAAVPGWK